MISIQFLIAYVVILLIFMVILLICLHNYRVCHIFSRHRNIQRRVVKKKRIQNHYTPSESTASTGFASSSNESSNTVNVRNISSGRRRFRREVRTFPAQREPVTLSSTVRLEVVNEAVAAPSKQEPRFFARRGSFSGTETMETSRESLTDDPLVYENFWKQYKNNVMKQTSSNKSKKISRV